MTRRTELEPMSMTATGGPWSSRPCAETALNAVFDVTLAEARLRTFGEADEAARRRFFERLPTAGQTRIGHEILVSIERLLARSRLYARGTAVRQELPALLIVLEVRHHDLVQHLFMHGRIGDRT